MTMSTNASTRLVAEGLFRKHSWHNPRGCRAYFGQALVEFAVMLPFLLLLALGVIEIGRYAYIGILVGSAARAGAAYGSARANNSATSNAPNVQLAATNDFQSNGQTTTLNVSSFSTCGCDNSGTISPDDTASCSPLGVPPTCPAGHWAITMHVTAQGRFSSLFSYPGIPSPLDISRTASMRVAQN
jgi:Flp pilus assembly protein TadG